MPASAAEHPPATGYLYYRHALPVRVMHWINVVALTILLMSGLSIFNAHPALYWGKSSYTGAPPLLAMQAVQRTDREIAGITHVFGREFDTTGLFGASKNRNGRLVPRGFPWWATIPDNQWLSMARSWHFFFAWVFVLNGLSYILYSLGSRHLARDLAPTRDDWRGIGRSSAIISGFAILAGEASKRYNILQKLAYLVVIFVLLPLIVLMGLAMSPWVDALVARMGRHRRRPPIGTDDSFHRGVAARRLCPHPPVRGGHHGSVEQPALDRHRTLPRPCRGKS